MAVVLALVGVVGLTVFLWFCWPPLALLPVSIGCLAAGVLIDWERLRGQPSPQARRSR